MISWQTGEAKQEKIAISVSFLITAIFISLIILQMSKFINELFTNKNIILKIDHIFSPEIVEKINNIVQTELNPNCNFKQICINAVKNIQSIKQIDIRPLGSGKSLFKVYANSPLLILNNLYNKQEYVLTEKEICDKDDYKEYMLENLHKIDINVPNILNIKPDLLKLSTISEEILQNYKITWHSDTKIILKPKACNKYYIVAHAQSLLIDKVKLAEKIYTKSTKGKCLKIDIRFKKFIVCAHLKGVVDEN